MLARAPKVSYQNKKVPCQLFWRVKMQTSFSSFCVSVFGPRKSLIMSVQNMNVTTCFWNYFDERVVIFAECYCSIPKTLSINCYCYTYHKINLNTSFAFLQVQYACLHFCLHKRTEWNRFCLKARTIWVSSLQEKQVSPKIAL